MKWFIPRQKPPLSVPGPSRASHASLLVPLPRRRSPSLARVPHFPLLMDDPWRNAWGDPSSTHPETSAWSTPASQPDEEEADLAAPSWSTGLGIEWNEPPDVQGSLWSQNTISDPWSPPANTFEGLTLGRTSSMETPESPDEVTTSEADSEPPSTDVVHDAVATPTVASEQETEHSAPSSPSPDPSLTSSPDAFGTFEIGANADDIDPWPASAAGFGQQPSDQTWGAAWADTTEETPTREDRQQSVDEWEEARRRKEELDRKVPPELLATIFAQVEELSKDAWPEPENPEVEADWQKTWRRGLDGVEGLDSLRARYVPDMILPPLKTFNTTFTSKAMAESIKLSRNTMLARNSPMAHFLKARGSTAWENHVKSRVEVIHDEVPAGWRIVPKENQEKTEEKTKKPGGLLASLWHRRASSVPRETAKVTSPVQVDAPKPEPPAPVVRTSSESARSATSSASKTTTPLSAPAMSPALTATSTQTTPTTSYSEAGLPSFDSPASVAETPSPPQSSTAVSRFFGRFSRSRVPSTSSPRNSIALSTSDVEFLSDLVPSALDADEDETKDPQLRGLESLIASKPIGGKLPAPLPPPPPPPQLASAPSVFNGAHAKTASSDILASFDVLTPEPASRNQSPAPSAGLSSSSLPPPNMSPFTLSSQPTSPAQYSARSGLGVDALEQAASRATDISLTAFQFDAPKKATTAAMTPSSSAAALNLSPPPKPVGHSLQSRSESPALSLPPPPPPATRSQSSSPFVTSPSSPAKTKDVLPVAKPPSIPLKSFDADDDFSDFSDFHSSTQVPLTPAFDASFASSASEHFLLPSTSSRQPLTLDTPARPSHPIGKVSLFDDFSDFVSSPLRSPSPPKLPSKPTLVPLRAPDDSDSRSSSPLRPSPISSLAHRRQGSRALEHQHTLNLVESAAKLRGKRWPAPPSPLPDALPPPPPPASASTGQLLGEDLLGGGANDDHSHFSLQQSSSSPALLTLLDPLPPPTTLLPPPQARPTASLPPLLPPPQDKRVASPPALLPPPPRSKPATPSPAPLLPPPPSRTTSMTPPISAKYSPESTPLALLVGGSSPPPVAYQPPIPPPPSKPSGAGGLSAQDLSFFEGL
ncbi:hypothetical protein DENSPDRAFT_543165 [Dentipellis sp. KUC8613]|nr:hypothetical protein DENSPDRAFT_543165 [Dentipellis sp. KUC8613]